MYASPPATLQLPEQMPAERPFCVSDEILCVDVCTNYIHSRYVQMLVICTPRTWVLPMDHLERGQGEAGGDDMGKGHRSACRASAHAHPEGGGVGRQRVLDSFSGTTESETGVVQTGNEASTTAGC